jgi:phosphoribosyl 1,2-cyclic phosphodiesterase
MVIVGKQKQGWSSRFRVSTKRTGQSIQREEHHEGGEKCRDSIHEDAARLLRNLGRDLRAIGHKQEQIRIAFTHFHWDHIQGFPFFAPAYDPKQRITLLTLGRGQTVTD